MCGFGGELRFIGTSPDYNKEVKNMYVIKFYSKKWKGNAFYNGKKDQFPRCYGKKVDVAKGYKLEHNAKKVAAQLSELSGVVHGVAVKR